MRLFIQLILTIIICTAILSCGASSAVTPPTDNPEIRISVTRLNPASEPINSVLIRVKRTQDGVTLPGRNIGITSGSGSVGSVTDRGDGTYEAIWTGSPTGEITVLAEDKDSDPPLQVGLTFIALEFLSSEWDVPVKLQAPVSTNGWETAPVLHPDGRHLAFAYITLDMVALAAGYKRPIGEERPGQSIPQTLNIYLASRPDLEPGAPWWSGWTVENAAINHFQSSLKNISAPSISSGGLHAFCTIQEINGSTYSSTKIYSVDPDFMQTPVALGHPVDMAGLGEDNPYYDATNRWLYFDTYDPGNPLSKQNLWAAQSYGSMQFYDPVPLTDLNTSNVETQAFVHAPSGMIYFASDRQADEFVLAIWRATVFGTSTGFPELVAKGKVAVGRPSISHDGEWFCFAYARFDPGGANADIAMCRKMEL